MMKEPRNDLLGRDFESARAFKLMFEHIAEFRRERKHPPFPVFRFSGFEPQPASIEIEVMLLPGQYLRRDAPTGNIGSLNRWFEVAREMIVECLVMPVLEKPLTAIVLTEHRKVRRSRDLAGLICKRERALERGQ